MDTELAEIRDFLARHAPFDTLPKATLDRLPARLEVRYFRRGSQILGIGQDTDAMFVLRSGAVDIRDGNGDLVERAESGTSFAMSPLLQEAPSAYEFTAIEDSLALAVPAKVFLDLCADEPAAKAFFDQRHRQRMSQALVGSQLGERAGLGLKTQARDLLRRPLEAASAAVSIREAAETMRRQGVSSLVLMDERRGTTADAGRLIGIVTDRDLRNRVLAEGRDPSQPVTQIMTPDPVTGSVDALAFELLMVMVDCNIHHLPIVDGDQVVGVVTSTDLMRLEQANPIYLVGDVHKAAALGDLVALSRRLPQVVQQLVDEAASPDDIGRVATAVGDAIGRRLLELAEAELDAPPVPYCWVVLGSQARLEQGLGSDQDHALILSDDATAEHDDYFRALAARVSDGLAACGYGYCTGEAMATNPKWRQSVTQWRHTYSTWFKTPDPDAVLGTGIFFDMRALYGDADLCRVVQEHVRTQARHQPAFLAHLAKRAVENQPPLGFFRGFVLERAGEHVATLNLKHKGIGPIVDLARVHALATGVAQLNTQARLRAAAAAGRLSADTAAELSGALEFIGRVRLRHQGRQVRAGREPDNYVSPEELTSFEKRHLRDAFQIVKHAQGVLAQSYPLHYMS
jgi:CBS domain-containing protein